MSQLSILREDGEAVVTLIVPGDPKSPYVARDDHPNFKVIVATWQAWALEGDEDALAELPSLFNVADTIAVKFQRLSERVTVENGSVKFDGVAIDSTLAQQILDVIQEGGTNASYAALVAFMEKVYTNPDPATATRIYDWLKAQDGLTITEAGDIVGYKLVNADDTYGYRSIASGYEPVNVRFADGTEETFTGRIPNPVGAVVEMPRNLVNNNAGQTCSVGLHVGAWGYMGGGPLRGNATLEVHVNPRDVVSVPTDYNGQKVRVNRYTVVGPVTEKYGQAIKVEGEAPRERRSSEAAPTTREDLDLTLAPLREANKAEEVVDAVPTWEDGDRFVDWEGDYGTVTVSPNGSVNGAYDDDQYADDLTPCGLEAVNAKKVASDNAGSIASARTHGKGGPTSQAAKGRGKNPAQDALGRFSGGRPGSTRDSSTGRFAPRR